MGHCVSLLARAPGDPVAIRGGVVVTAAELLAQAAACAAGLADGTPVINLCEDRLRFAAWFVAALLRGAPSLLPPNPLPDTLRRLRAAWPGAVTVTDATPAGAPVPAAAAAAPADDALAAVVYTGGTTAEPLPLHKTWGNLRRGTALNLPHYLPGGTGPYAVVATVPAQHLYGLETTVLAALRGAVTLHAGRPLFPADVRAALEEAPAPRVLVTTPVHLRALLRSGLAYPRVERVLSATAPLGAEVAAAAEDCFGGALVEIYGCSETGSLAWRRTAREPRWHLFGGCTAHADGDGTAVTAPHLAGRVLLPDVLDWHADGGFTLAGRRGDLVKVAGKRTSLAAVTEAIATIPGVEDAVALRADLADEDGRLAALVVSRTLDAEAVRHALRGRLDAAFVPRPIRVVPALPRSAVGKLNLEAARALLRDAGGTRR